jgi:two-component system NtrC family sensor kinase
MRARDLEGRPRWYDYELIPLDRPPLKVIVVAADVTAEVEYEAEREQSRKQMEQAARLAALGELIGGVAHELNNPLTAILGFAEVMAASETLAGHAEEVGIIRKEALRARDVVRDLLFIARPGPVERTQVSLADVVGHIERIRRSSWAREEITVSVDTGGLAGTVWGNEHQLTQVLINLVTNAEHALEGIPRPSLAITARMEKGEAVISVRDNGLGMDAATRDRIFEPFFTTKQGVGTGLGLSLSYTMVTAHGGRIEVESEPGQGSEFRVILPSPPDSPAAPAPPAETPAETPATGLRILVVDDEPNLRKVCQRLIARMGHSCEAADSSASARDLAAVQDFDLVICDYRLASETAAAVIAAFEEVAPQLLRRTVIATGASNDPGVIDLTERYAMQLVAKPYGLEQIAALIGQASRNSDG